MSIKNVSHVAQNLLARREHSKTELRDKLLSRGFDIDDINYVTDQLSQQGLQSNARFAESCYRYRSQKGYGPNYIRQYLKNKGIDDELIYATEHDVEIDWQDCIKKVWTKKYLGMPMDAKSVHKQKQFLYYRGFDTELILHLFNEL